MKMIALMAVVPIVAMAETVELPKTPKPRYADCEECVSKAMTLWKDGTRSVTVDVECDCTGHNALRVGLGKDANKNGELEPHEMRLQFGWDAQGWVLRSVDQWLDFEEPLKLEKERRTLKVAFRFDDKGELVGFAAWDGMKRIFVDVSKNLPKGLYAKDNDIVQVKRNGVDDPNERVTISVDPQHNTGYVVPGHHVFIMPNAIKGSGNKEDKPSDILALIKERAETGDVELMYAQGLVNLYGITGDPFAEKKTDFPSALAWFRKAAAKGHAAAQYEAAMLITKMPALADPANPSERDALMRKAAAAGDPLAKEWASKNGLK